MIKPKITVIDKTEFKMLKRNPVAQFSDGPDTELDNFYFKRYESDEIYIGEGMLKSVDIFVNKFMDGRLKHDYNTE